MLYRSVIDGSGRRGKLPESDWGFLGGDGAGPWEEHTKNGSIVRDDLYAFFCRQREKDEFF